MMTDSYTAPHETTDGDAKAATPHHTVPPPDCGTCVDGGR